MRGSKLLGQNSPPKNIFIRALPPPGNGYDAANSSGSNLGPTSQKLNDAIKDRIAAYRKENGLKETDPFPPMPSPLPAAVSTRTSACATRSFKLPRVAKARGSRRRQSART